MNNQKFSELVDTERRIDALWQEHNPESVLAIWLYALYSTIYASAFGTIPAGVLGIASLGVGLAVREAKEMV